MAEPGGRETAATGVPHELPAVVVTAQEPVAAQITAEYPGWDVISGPLGWEARRDGEVVRAVSPAGMRELLSSYAMTSGGRQAGREHGQNISGHGLGLSREELERQLPRWHMWKGIAGLWYASRRNCSPPVVVRGEDLRGLRDEIRRWLGTH
jgi:hypothetical protein